MQTRREFIKTGLYGTGGLILGGLALNSTDAFAGKKRSANDVVRVGIVGFSDRCRGSLIPAFMNHAEELGFEIVAVSDIWKRRREEAEKFFMTKYNKKIKTFVNNEALYESKMVDAVIISTADFQHATHLVEAVKAGCDAYCEKPFAETMADARMALKIAGESNKVIQIGSQRRSAPNYQAAYDYINSGKFGSIAMVEMCWNVNQPQRWRRPKLVSECFEQDTDWKRFLCNRPYEPWDPRKYLEYRLFWPYSSGIPGQWMSHQIDTVHWFTGLSHPTSVAANGGIHMWDDGRTNCDTLTAVMEYAPCEVSKKGFQVLYTSRFTNSAGGTKELYFSNGGCLNLDTNEVTSTGGLREGDAKQMGMEANLLETFKLPSVNVSTEAHMGGDPMTSLHMRNWMECVRSRKQTNAPVQAGYNHSIATMMSNAAVRTGLRVTFDEQNQEIMCGDKPFDPFA